MIAQHQLDAREVYAQLKAVRRLLLQLSDTLGDMSINREFKQSSEAEAACDRLTDLEYELNNLQTRFAAISRGEP